MVAAEEEVAMRYCTVCTEVLPVGMRPDALYCSVACRMRAMRLRTKGLRDPLSVTSGGYTSVTDNPPVAPISKHPAAVLDGVEELVATIPADLTIPEFLRRDSDAPHWKLLDPP